MVKTKKIISLFFVALFVSYYASITLFSHSHIISGTTIVHSHIHTNSHHNTKAGGHIIHSITLIAQFSHFECIDFSCYYIPDLLQLPIGKNTFFETTHWVTSIYFENLSLRAPPIV